ncbi:MAG: 16S rRNA (uracil(1498)-N(3))-methyltransferase [Ruminococcus sp.]|nr:16S rRNA (uracil(1498)-N(3))-methyltransferase [Ruminococcus sp.]
MPRFFVEKKNISDTYITISGDDARHIGRSLRMKLSEKITVCCQNTDYECEIKSISDEEVVARIISVKKNISEPDILLTLFQAVPKADKLEFIVQKAVELGAAQIVPVLTRRCVAKYDEKSFAKKLVRLQKIAKEAAMQSGRGIVPKISSVITLNDYCERLDDFDLNLLCYEGGGRKFSEIDSLKEAKSVSLFIGSEGGFDEEEVLKATQRGAVPVTLGNRILRCETAPICAISIIMNLSGNI